MAGEEQRLGAQHRVHAHLGQQSGEDRGDRGGGGRVGVGQPSGEREHGRLDGEDRQQHRLQQGAHAERHLLQPLGELGEVHGAGDRVGHGDGDQEEHGGEQRDDHVRRSGPDAGRGAADGEQHEAGDEHDLEADVEVDEVPGEEGAGDAGHEDEVGGVEDADRRLVVAVGHALAQRVHEDEQGDGAGDGEHQAGQPVGDEGDADRRREVAEVHAERAVPVGGDHQQHGEHQDGAEHGEADEALEPVQPGPDGQLDPRDAQGQQDGERDERVHLVPSVPAPPGSSGWSGGGWPESSPGRESGSRPVSSGSLEGPAIRAGAGPGRPVASVEPSSLPSR